MRHAAATLSFVVLSMIGASTQVGPTITSFTIDHGVGQTTSDQVTLRFTYTNPAAVGQPIAFYRLRYKPPTQADFFAFGQWLPGPTGTPVLTMVLARSGGAPVAGDHRYQLQIRDSRGQVSATAEATIRRLLSATPPAPTPVVLETYRVTGPQVAEALRVARQRGFRHTVLPVNANSKCSLEDDANDVWFRLNSRGLLQLQPTPQCRIRLFEGQSLQPNWHLKSAAFKDLEYGRARWVLEQPLKPAGRDASFVVYGQLTMPERVVPGTTLSWINAIRVMTELAFEGPSGKTWRQAFEP
jgi:hypothetical protein